MNRTTPDEKRVFAPEFYRQLPRKHRRRVRAAVTRPGSPASMRNVLAARRWLELPK